MIDKTSINTIWDVLVNKEIFTKKCSIGIRVQNCRRHKFQNNPPIFKLKIVKCVNSNISLKLCLKSF